VNKQKGTGSRRLRRRQHVRNKLRGDGERPRTCVHRSLQHISVQIIDDFAGKTLLAVSTGDRDMREQLKYGGNSAAAAVIGKRLAEQALQAGIGQVRFDRGHCKYHGRVAALADAAREAGLKF
jgi:large subunit ribosomal protein L18